MHPLTVVLADDHPILREGVAAFFDEHPDLHIVGQCSDGLAAVEMIKTLAPDFAIIDLQLAKLHGLEVIQKLREANSTTKLVVLTAQPRRKDDELGTIRRCQWICSEGWSGTPSV